MNNQNLRKELEEKLNERLLFCGKKGEIITAELFHRKNVM